MQIVLVSQEDHGNRPGDGLRCTNPTRQLLDRVGTREIRDCEDALAAAKVCILQQVRQRLFPHHVPDEKDHVHVAFRRPNPELLLQHPGPNGRRVSLRELIEDIARHQAALPDTRLAEETYFEPKIYGCFRRLTRSAPSGGLSHASSHSGYMKGRTSWRLR